MLMVFVHQFTKIDLHTVNTLLHKKLNCKQQAHKDITKCMYD